MVLPCYVNNGFTKNALPTYPMGNELLPEESGFAVFEVIMYLYLCNSVKKIFPLFPSLFQLT